MRRVAVGLAVALLSAATVALFLISRGKWSDPIIDSGREWIVPDSLARGDLLYRDVVYWFGPFTPYFVAAFFLLFGSSFGTLVLAGLSTSAAIVLAAWLALRRVTARLEAVLAEGVIVAALIFMPCVAGGAGGAILGMGMRMWQAAAFTVLAVALAVAPPGSRLRWVGIGALCGLAALCRTEWGLAALGGCVLASWTRSRFGAAFWRSTAVAAGAFAGTFGAGIAVFLVRAGSRAVIRDGHVFMTGLPPETRRFLFNVSGFQDPGGGVLRLLTSFAAWTAAVLILKTIGSWRREDRLRRDRRLAYVAGAVLMVAIYHSFVSALPMALFSAAPLIGVASVAAGFRHGRTSRAAALVAFGALAVLLSYRKLFSISDSAYVAPPLLFASIAGAGLLFDVVVRSAAGSRRTVRAILAGGLAALALFGFCGRALQYWSDPRVAVPDADGWVFATPRLAAGIQRTAAAIRARTAPESGLVVFPEGEIFNYATGRRNPLRHKLYIPPYISGDQETAVLRELEIARPSAVVLVFRRTAEYGRPTFGIDYGTRLYAWVQLHYAPADPPEGMYLPTENEPVRLLLRN